MEFLGNEKLKEAKGTMEPDLNDRLRSLIEEGLRETEFELVDIEYRGRGDRSILRVFVDKEGGVSVDDCAWVSSRLSDLLDTKDPIPHSYTLEVSSPGGREKKGDRTR